MLELKQIPYEVIPVHLVKDGGAQNKEAFSSKVNPMKQVPALVLPDGTVLTQSVAICEYLEEEPEYNAKTQPSLLPDDPTQRALVRKIVELVNSGIQPGITSTLNLSTLYDLYIYDLYTICRGYWRFFFLLLTPQS